MTGTCAYCEATFTGRREQRFCSKPCAYRGIHRPGQQQKSHCKYGHELTPENTRLSGRRRNCRTCDRNRDAARSTLSRSRPIRTAPKTKLPAATPPPAPAPVTEAPRPVWRPAGFAPLPNTRRAS